MALASLLKFADTPTFAFEHAMAHRTLLAGPNILDPMQQIANRASKWHLDHQQAHNDAMTALNVASHQNLIDSALQPQGPVRFWSLANHTEHLSGMDAILRRNP